MSSDTFDNYRFTKEFTKQEPLPEESIQQAIEVMRSGRLHRYNNAPGDLSETSMLEKEFADYLGKNYCLACTSCGSALYLALLSAGVKQGTKVLTNAYTLAPVPGAIYNAGGITVLVDIEEDYTIDLNDLERKAELHKAHYLLLSHMRGHIADMDRISAICEERDIILIEDCAHTMGARWNGRLSGSFGSISCFSTQTYKHLNSGEGGLLATDDDSVIARAILYSGSYMLYEKHRSRPPLEIFAPLRESLPNYSLRMDNLRAAILRPQLRGLDQQCRRWNERYDVLEAALRNIEHIRIPDRPEKESYVGSSIQFSLADVSLDQAQTFVERCCERGVDVKWFGWPIPTGFTSTYEHWRFIGDVADLSKTKKILDYMCDIRVPLTFTLADCRQVAEIIEYVAAEVCN